MRAGRAITSLFAVTAFFGAGMLFLVQPMIARLLLPSYGGSATVWSTSSLFFQVVLLLGYVYTDRATRIRPSRLRLLHAVVLLTPLLVLPLALPGDAAPGAGTSPILWLLRTLALMIGLPFAVLATTGPLLQKWYSWSGLGRAEDPYFLFAASNLGSFVGLLSYPFLVEPFVTVSSQLRAWSWGFGVFVLLTGGCMLVTARTQDSVGMGRRPEPALHPEVDEEAHDDLTVRRVLTWMALAFLPSGLMLAVTSHVSTDIAAIPLLWVIPLAIYLGTFVAAFARTSRRPLVRLTRVAVVVAVMAALSATVGLARQTVLFAVAIQMVMLALVAFASHARLAADRPTPARLTTFYLVVAVGGALGGLLNGVIAPLVFDRVLEYPLLIVTVPLLLIGLGRGRRSTAEPGRERRGRSPLAMTAGLLVVAAVLAVVAHGALLAAVVAVAIVGTVLAWILTRWPQALCAVLVVAQVALLVAANAHVIDRRRTFYGSLTTLDEGGQHVLVDGTTLHGTQFLDARSDRPTTYYSHSGPLGDVFASRRYDDVAVVGLGAGTIATYGRPGEQLTFFEINPAVADIARDPHLFTYLRDSRADVHVVVGDGRLELQSAPARSYDLIVLDAFSSDSIPVHLLTREAVSMYADRLRPGGLLVFHITNATFDLRPVLEADANALGWVGVVGTRSGDKDGGRLSTWAVLAARTSDLGDIPGHPGWTPLPSRSIAWTDDYSSVLRVLK